MTTDVENNEWKAEAPYLASLPKVNPFRVPEQYFDALTPSINGSIFVERLKGQVTAAGFTVPENYFDTLQEQITAQTSGTLPFSRPQSHGYSTPEGYFEKLQASILAKTIEQEKETIDQEIKPAKKEAKIIRLWHSDMLKYASAACFILITAFGLYLNNQRYSPAADSAADIANEQMLYDIDEQDIIEHVQNVSTQELGPEANSPELETYILNNYSQNDLSTNL